MNCKKDADMDLSRTEEIREGDRKLLKRMNSISQGKGSSSEGIDVFWGSKEAEASNSSNDAFTGELNYGRGEIDGALTF